MTTALGSLFQCLTTLSGKKTFSSYPTDAPLMQFHIIPLSLTTVIRENSTCPSTLLVRSPLSLFFSRLNKSNDLSCSFSLIFSSWKTPGWQNFICPTAHHKTCFSWSHLLSQDLVCCILGNDLQEPWVLGACRISASLHSSWHTEESYPTCVTCCKRQQVGKLNYKIVYHPNTSFLPNTVCIRKKHHILCNKSVFCSFFIWSNSCFLLWVRIFRFETTYKLEGAYMSMGLNNMHLRVLREFID